MISAPAALKSGYTRAPIDSRDARFVFDLVIPFIASVTEMPIDAKTFVASKTWRQRRTTWQCSS